MWDAQNDVKIMLSPHFIPSHNMTHKRYKTRTSQHFWLIFELLESASAFLPSVNEMKWWVTIQLQLNLSPHLLPLHKIQPFTKHYKCCTKKFQNAWGEITENNVAVVWVVSPHSLPSYNTTSRKIYKIRELINVSFIF